MMFSKLLPVVKQVLNDCSVTGDADFVQLVKDEFAGVTADTGSSVPDSRQMRVLYELRARYLDWELGTGYLGFFARNPGTQYTFIRRLEAIRQMLPAWSTETISSTPPRRMLDIGCGAGLLCLELAERAEAVVGIDISRTALDFANRMNDMLQYRHVMFQQGDAEHLAFEDETFDLVICSEVLEHVLDPGQALAEIRRVVKPGGTVIVTTPCALSLSDLTMKALRVLFPRLESEKNVQFDKKAYLAVQRKARETSKNETTGSPAEEKARFLRVHERFRYTSLVKMFQEAGFSVEQAQGTIVAFPPHYQVFYRGCPGWLLFGVRLLERLFNRVGVFQRFGAVTTCFQLGRR